MNFALLILSLVLVACVSGFTQQEYQDAFVEWVQKYQRAYTAEEFNERFAIFKDNMDYVEKWNSRNSETILGLTVFADLTNEEYQEIYLGTKVTRQLEKVVTVPTFNLPASVDWRNSGAVTAIKNQGQCGSCWSFSTTGSVEGIHKLATGNLVSLSEQNLMDCSKSYGNEGCNGGLMDDAFKYIIANNGIDTEASYPYTAKEGTCKFQAANVGATIATYSDVSHGSESALQVASAQQPVSVAIDASHNSFQLYSSGVYYEPACSATSLDHGVLVIGYGTSGSSDYWLVKNSWGTDWGIQGYIWMSRNRDNNCGIATQASYPSFGSMAATTHHNATTTHAATHATTAHTVATGRTTYGSFYDLKEGGGRGFKPNDAQAAKIVF